MLRAVGLTGLALATSCTPSQGPSSPDIDVALGELLATPSLHHERRVSTEGYLATSDTAGALFTSPSAASSFDAKSGIRVLPGSHIQTFSKFDKMYVRITGTFEMERGRSGPWIGTIAVSSAEESKPPASWTRDRDGTEGVVH